MAALIQNNMGLEEYVQELQNYTTKVLWVQRPHKSFNEEILPPWKLTSDFSIFKRRQKLCRELCGDGGQADVKFTLMM